MMKGWESTLLSEVGGGGSLVDYVLASQNLFPFVKEFDVQDRNILSDHCVIIFLGGNTFGMFR